MFDRAVLHSEDEETGKSAAESQIAVAIAQSEETGVQVGYACTRRRRRAKGRYSAAELTAARSAEKFDKP